MQSSSLAAGGDEVKDGTAGEHGEHNFCASVVRHEVGVVRACCSG